MSFAVRKDKQGWRSVSSAADIAEGEYFSNEVPVFEPTSNQALDLFKSEIQAHMDSLAVAAGYDDIKTAVTYAEEPAVQKFQTEGKAFRAWRSLVWAYGYEQIEAVQSGEREMPTVEGLIAELPALVMP